MRHEVGGLTVATIHTHQEGALDSDCAPCLRAVLGDLIDALSDEVRYEVGESPHVVGEIDLACRLLGGPYEGYIGKWND
jgi:hypothetical protein